MRGLNISFCNWKLCMDFELAGLPMNMVQEIFELASLQLHNV